MGPFQAKLTVNTPLDIYEQEADRVADAVMGKHGQSKGPVLKIVPQKACRLVMRPEDKFDSILPTEEETEAGVLESAPSEEMQRSASSETALPGQFESAVDGAMQSGGVALPPTTQSFMEGRIGWDFSSVRIHDDTTAHSLARKVNARAFTLGNHVFFDQTQYHPQSGEGQRLLAHELTHVVQQSNGRLSRKLQRQTSCSSYAGYNSSANLISYNCAGLALRTYQWHSPPDRVYDAIVANFVGAHSPAGQCGAGKVKFWLWEYDIHTEDDQGNMVDPPWRDFHIVAGRVDTNGNDPTDVYTKNGKRPVYGPGTGPSFRPPLRDRATTNSPSEQPITTPQGRPVFKVRTNMSEAISCADCYP